MISGLRRERFLTCLEANRLNRTSTSVRKAGSKENKSKFENPLLSRPTIGFWSKAELTPIPRSRIHFPNCNRDCDECRLSPHLSLTSSASLSLPSRSQVDFRNLQHWTRSAVIQDRPIGYGTRVQFHPGPRTQSALHARLHQMFPHIAKFLGADQMQGEGPPKESKRR